MDSLNNITIVVASDNLYAVMVAVLIKSIEINHKTKELISFYIIDDGISKSNKRKLQSSVNPAMTTLYWIKSSDLIPLEIKMPSDQSSLPNTTYLRIFAPYATNPNCKKLIYMDVDMLLYDDISKLYNVDINDNVLAAIQDTQEVFSASFAIPNYKDLGIPGETKYFNAGLMLIDCEKWIKNEISFKVMKCLHDNLKHVFYADQYGLNVVLNNKWIAISN